MKGAPTAPFFVLLTKGRIARERLIGHSCFMAKFTGLMGDHPVLEAHYARLQQRLARQRA